MKKIGNINRFAIVQGFKEWEFKGLPYEVGVKIADIVDSDVEPDAVKGVNHELLQILVGHFKKVSWLMIEDFVARSYDAVHELYTNDELVATLAALCLAASVRDHEWERRHNAPAKGLYAVYNGATGKLVDRKLK